MKSQTMIIKERIAMMGKRILIVEKSGVSMTAKDSINTSNTIILNVSFLR